MWKVIFFPEFGGKGCFFILEAVNFFVTASSSQVYRDSCKAFDMVPHNILVTKLERYEFDGCAI